MAEQFLEWARDNAEEVATAAGGGERGVLVVPHVADSTNYAKGHSSRAQPSQALARVAHASLRSVRFDREQKL